MIPAQDTSLPDETLLRYAGWRAVLACFLMALFLFGFAPLRPGHLPGRTAAPEWLAARVDLGGQHAVLS
jgi:hypothetical protein